MINDFYRLIMLIALTLIVLSSLQYFQKHLIKSFLNTHKDDGILKQLDHLTLMVITISKKEGFSDKLIERFKKINFQEFAGSVLSVTPVQDFSEAFKLAGKLKIIEHINATDRKIGLNPIVKELFLKKKVMSDQKLAEYITSQKVLIANKLKNRGKFSGFFFISFHSAIDMIRFKRFINPYFNKNRK